MKTKIRQGVFETNSSSEHTISVMKSDLYDRWVNGEIAVRFYETNESSFNDTWGNFWSEQMFIEVCDMKDAKERNSERIRNIADDCVNKLKATERKIATMDGETRADYIDTYGDDIFDKMVKDAKEKADFWNNHYDEIAPDDKLYYGLFITKEEYDYFLKHGDVHSPFFHKNGDVVVFGTYYHS